MARFPIIRFNIPGFKTFSCGEIITARWQRSVWLKCTLHFREDFQLKLGRLCFVADSDRRHSGKGERPILAKNTDEQWTMQCMVCHPSQWHVRVIAATWSYDEWGTWHVGPVLWNYAINAVVITCRARGCDGGEERERESRLARVLGKNWQMACGDLYIPAFC